MALNIIENYFIMRVKGRKASIRIFVSWSHNQILCLYDIIHENKWEMLRVSKNIMVEL